MSYLRYVARCPEVSSDRSFSLGNREKQLTSEKLAVSKASMPRERDAVVVASGGGVVECPLQLLVVLQVLGVPSRALASGRPGAEMK